MRFTRILKGLVLFACMLSFGAAPALADQTSQDAADLTSQDAADEKAVQLEATVVVGDKMGRDIQELPTSASVIDTYRIESEPIRNIEDVFNRLANVSTGTAQFGAYSIRGVNNNALSSSFIQTNALATVFVNQAPLGNYTSDFLRPSVWDVTSVEVLRGPQSTMQGPNSLIGAVFLNYKRPDFSLDGAIRGEFGEYNTWNAAAYQNLPLVEDTLAARISLETRNSDGAVESAVDGSDDIARIDERMIRGQVLFQPLGNKDISFNLTGIYNKSDSNLHPYVTGSDLSAREANLDAPGEYPSEVWLLSLESEIKIDGNWKIMSVTGFSDLAADMEYDADLTPEPLMVVDAEQKERAFNQDLRLEYNGQRLRGLLGAYFSYSNATALYGSESAPDSVLPSLAFDLEEKTTTAAVYVNIDFDILPSLTLNGGLRYNYEDRESLNTSEVSGLTASLEGQDQYKQLLPSFSLTYRFTDEISAGVKYGRGYRSGGVSIAPFAQVAEPYDEEYTNNYEVFFRSKLFDNRLTINTNIYYTEWFDMQVPVLVPDGLPGFDNIIENAGEAELMGFELEVTYKPITGLTLFTSLGYSHAEFVEFTVNGVDRANQALPNAPEWTVSIGANYTHVSGFFGGFTYRWTDETYSVVSSPDITRISSRSILDLKTGYRAKHWSVYLWATNLLDDDYELHVEDSTLWGIDGYGVMGQPRVVGIGAEILW